MSRSRLFLIGALVSLSAGCATRSGSQAHPLNMTVPEKWKSGETLATTYEDRWWVYLGDSGLSAAIEAALENNQDLRATAIRIEAAEAEARMAGAALKPAFNLGLARQRQRRNFVGLPIEGLEERVFSTTFTNTGVNLGLSWEADVWGRIRAGEAAAFANVRARQADWAGSRLSLSGQVAKAWFAAVEARRQVGLARATLESYRSTVDRVRDRYQLGVGNSLDLRLALTEVDGAVALVEERKTDLEVVVRQLETLMSRYPGGEYELGEDLPAVAPGVPGGLPSDLLHRRPDLIAGEQEILAADARLIQARSDLRPRFPLTGAFGTASTQLRNYVRNPLEPGMMAWNLLANVVQPLYAGGRLRAQVQRDEALVAAAVVRYEAALLQAYQEVETALAVESLLEKREAAVESSTRRALAARDLAQERYWLGLADVVTVLTAQRTTLEAESGLLTLRRLRLGNRVNLHLALGGGFTDALPAQPSGTPAVRLPADPPRAGLDDE